MKVGLFFGTYNPVHIGHLVIANYMVEFTDMDQLWMVVTPQNPFKQKKSLLRDFDRLHLVNLAIGDDQRLRSSDIEFKLPKPNYTCDTLVYLKEKFPNYEFCLIMGADNLNHFHKWKNYGEILKNHEIYVYPRLDSNEGGELRHHEKVNFVDAPIIRISSSFIRKSIRGGKNIKYFMPEKVSEYIDEMGLYEH